ncbi:MAG: hypothetical protein R3F11_11700 [Verrucomicrobiales bacterium]
MAGGSLPSRSQPRPGDRRDQRHAADRDLPIAALSASSAFGTDYFLATLTIYPALAIAEAVDSRSASSTAVGNQVDRQHPAQPRWGGRGAKLSGVPEYEGIGLRRGSPVRTS